MVKHASRDLDAVFAALANPTRRAILARLRRGSGSVSDLAAPFPVSLPAISKHLGVLERAGLISRSRSGRVSECRLDAGAMRSAAAWLSDYETFWTRQFDSLDAYLSGRKDDHANRPRASASPFVRKVRVTLAEKGLDYELKPLFPFDVPAEYKKISPLGKIPAYEEDGRALSDSSIICAYLERANPEPSLYPSDPYEYGRALWFEEYGDSALAQNLGGGLFFQLIVAPRFLKRPTDQAAVDKALTQDIPPMFDYLESQLQAREVIAGTRFSIGDIGICTHFVNMQHAGHAVDAKRWPKLARYVSHVLARPSFKALIEEEAPLFRAAS